MRSAAPPAPFLPGTPPPHCPRLEAPWTSGARGGQAGLSCSGPEGHMGSGDMAPSWDGRAAGRTHDGPWVTPPTPGNISPALPQPCGTTESWELSRAAPGAGVCEEELPGWPWRACLPWGLSSAPLPLRWCRGVPWDGGREIS